MADKAPLGLGALSALDVTNVDDTALSLEAVLQASETDELVVMRDGQIIAEWAAEHRDRTKPHLLFSVSKSLTGLLAGILAGRGFLCFDRPILDYVPEVAGSAFADASLQHLFDMEVSVHFVEDYLDSSGGFDRYRRATGWNPTRAKIRHQI
jgi:CubicO group peptidase (beta-lactamase class C family)